MTEKIDLRDFPELARGLSPEYSSPNQAEVQCETAETILAECGLPTTINGMSASATPWSQEVKLGRKTLHARIAKLNPTKGKEQQLPMIVFDEDSDLSVSTVNYNALRYKKFAGRINLVAHNDIDPLVDDIKYLKLADSIIRDIAQKHAEDRLAKELEKAARGNILKRGASAVTGYFSDSELTNYGAQRKGEVRKFNAICMGVASLAAYGHLFFNDADAKLGPIPMPSLVELFVDGNNSPDHRAQGFDEPEGAAPVVLGEVLTELPILADYDTAGVPGATYRSFAAAVSDITLESRPGLYEVDLDFGLNDTSTEENDEEDDNVNDKRMDENGCFIVDGNFLDGQSSVFTQDIGTSESVRVLAQNTRELTICLKEGVRELEDGTIFIWQD